MYYSSTAFRSLLYRKVGTQPPKTEKRCMAITEKEHRESTYQWKEREKSERKSVALTAQCQTRREWSGHEDGPAEA